VSRQLSHQLAQRGSRSRGGCCQQEQVFARVQTHEGGTQRVCQSATSVRGTFELNKPKRIAFTLCA
jgi:hypothetical protein